MDKIYRKEKNYRPDHKELECFGSISDRFYAFHKKVWIALDGLYYSSEVHNIAWIAFDGRYYGSGVLKENMRVEGLHDGWNTIHRKSIFIYRRIR